MHSSQKSTSRHSYQLSRSSILHEAHSPLPLVVGQLVLPHKFIESTSSAFVLAFLRGSSCTSFEENAERPVSFREKTYYLESVWYFSMTITKFDVTFSFSLEFGSFPLATRAPHFLPPRTPDSWLSELLFLCSISELCAAIPSYQVYSKENPF